MIKYKCKKARGFSMKKSSSGIAYISGGFAGLALIGAIIGAIYSPVVMLTSILVGLFNLFFTFPTIGVIIENNKIRKKLLEKSLKNETQNVQPDKAYEQSPNKTTLANKNTNQKANNTNQAKPEEERER